MIFAIRLDSVNPRLTRCFYGGRYRTRTDDLFRVKEARYQLRQSPNSFVRKNRCASIIADRGGGMHIAAVNATKPGAVSMTFVLRGCRSAAEMSND
jgi:hypothetical protein